MINEVRILGMLFSVSEEVLDEPNEAGNSNACHRTIKIAAGLPEAARIETFYHEVAHMILTQSGVAAALGDEREEAVAQAMGFGLMQLLSQNSNLPTLGGAE